MIRCIITAALLMAGTPVLAEIHTISSGAGGGDRLRAALVLAEPGDEIALEAGRYEMTETLGIDVDDLTVRGAGSAQTVLDFTTQVRSGEGLRITSDNITLRDFAVENVKGDGIKSNGADDIVFSHIRITWTKGQSNSNGGHGISLTGSSGGLISHSEVSGASQTGIHVSQSNRVTVRNSIATDNVVGIGITDSTDVIVSQNYLSRNTGGVLVSEMPGLSAQAGANVLISGNLVVDNNAANFASQNDIVASVLPGTGIMVMAGKKVWIENNIVQRNSTASFMVIAYPKAFDDARYNPYPREVVVASNISDIGGTDPAFAGGKKIAAAFGGALPPILWDGLSQSDESVALRNTAGILGWTLNLMSLGQSIPDAKPAPLEVPDYNVGPMVQWLGAPPQLEARIP